ncbi:UNVERIFIED_CONTAM: hypothetical protein RMT77_010043 [Armadillidium vulgare]
MNANDIFDFLNYDFDEVSVTPDMLDQSLDPNEDFSLELDFSEAPHDGLKGSYSYAPKQQLTSKNDNFPVDSLSHFSLQHSLPTGFELALNNQFSNSCSIGYEEPNQFSNSRTIGYEEPNQFSNSRSIGYEGPYQFSNSCSVGYEEPNTSDSVISYKTFNGGLDSHGESSNSPGPTGFSLIGNSRVDSLDAFCDRNSNSPNYSEISSPESATASTNEKTRRTRKLLTDLTDEEKYARIRDQNNIASREYRNRKKSKTMLVENHLKEVTERNEKLKLLCQKLETHLGTYEKAKSKLESLGFDLSQIKFN